MADANENDNGDGSSGLGGWGGVADGNISGASNGRGGYSGQGLSIGGGGYGLSASFGSGLSLSGPAPSGLSIGADTRAGFAGDLGASLAVAGLESKDAVAQSGAKVEAAIKADQQTRAIVNGIKQLPVIGPLFAMFDNLFTIGKSLGAAFGTSSPQPNLAGSAPPSLFGGNASIGRSLSDGFSGGEVNEAGRIDSSPVLGFNGVTANRPGVTTKPAIPGRSYSLALAGPAGQPARYGASPAAGPDNSAGLVLAGLAALLTFN